MTTGASSETTGSPVLSPWWPQNQGGSNKCAVRDSIADAIGRCSGYSKTETRERWWALQISSNLREEMAMVMGLELERAIAVETVAMKPVNLGWTSYCPIFIIIMPILQIPMSPIKLELCNRTKKNFVLCHRPYLHLETRLEAALFNESPRHSMQTNIKNKIWIPLGNDLNVQQKLKRALPRSPSGSWFGTIGSPGLTCSL